MPGSEAVTFDCFEKSFFGVKVLKGVGFSLRAGRILGLVGENGAGKSTLMNLLGGNLQPDAGAMRVEGRPYTPQNPSDARAAGIAFVHQELNLFPNLSIAENLHLTAFPRVGGGTTTASPSSAGFETTCRNHARTGSRHSGWPWINRSALRSRTEKLLRQIGLDQAPDTLVELLPAGERQLVEIAKALGGDARVLILDEPTTSLSARECERLFALIHQLRERGIAMIFISHALGDVMRLFDDLVVLRDGEVAGAGPVPEFTQERLVSLMVGRQLQQLYPERARCNPVPAEDPPLLEVRSLSQPGVVREVSFTLARGEVLGIAGLMGAGRSELARILFGLDLRSSGEIRLAGQTLDGTPRDRIRRGLAFLTEDRRQEGLCMEASIADNITLVTLPSHGRTPCVFSMVQALPRR